MDVFYIFLMVSCGISGNSVVYACVASFLAGAFNVRNCVYMCADFLCVLLIDLI